MSVQSNPLLCDPESGVCEIPDSAIKPSPGETKAHKQQVRVIYFTDPICSSCWGIEPMLRRLKLEYGHMMDISYHMGGLLPDWSYNSGGISKPSDVAVHWDEVSLHYRMPIIGDVWMNDPLDSSYPPSIAFKAAELQDPVLAIQFLRVIREMVFIEGKNITRIEHLKKAAQQVRLDVKKFSEDIEGKARAAFESDLALARSQGVRGFPTLIFQSRSGKTERIQGVRPYTYFESALLRAFPGADKKGYDRSAYFLFSTFGSLTLNEYVSLNGGSEEECLIELQTLERTMPMKRVDTRNGAIWRYQ
jgi:predicted DsbA family dithiol-disulfide isomerase